jgi:serine/threonine protein kinase/Flp pilus assembly protein TadD
MIGKTISHYKIVNQIGYGGMGTVYKAIDLNLNRIVALKILSPSLTEDKEVIIRFKHEARSAAALDHPNICTIYEAAQVKGYSFIAMSFIEGENLKKTIQKFSLPLNQVIDYAIQIADGLQEAHEKKVIHRDIKSANIMITPKKKAVIMDFGLAKMEEMTQITSPGISMGTISYMSPEQARGEKIDHRADIWGLGVVIYEMITGKLPIKARVPHMAIYKIINDEPIRLSDLPKDTPPELVRIIEKALSKKLSERYKTVSALKNDLIQFIKTSSGMLLEHQSGKIKKRRMKHRLIELLLLLLILSAAVIIFIVISLLQKDQYPKSVAVLPFRDLSPTQDQQYFCLGMTEQLITSLSRITELKVIARSTVIRYQHTDKDAKQIGEELDVEYLIEGSVYKVGEDVRITAEMIKVEDGIQSWGNNYNSKLNNIFLLQDEVSAEIARSLKVKLSEKDERVLDSFLPKNVQAYDYYLRSKYYTENSYLNTGSEEDFKTAVNLAKKAIEIEPNFALGYFGLSYIYEHKYQITLDPECVKNALIYLNKSLELNPDLPEANAALGYYYSRIGKYDEAFGYLKKAYKSDPGNATILYMLASFYSNQGLLNDAIQYYTKAIGIDPFTFYLYDSRGYNYFCLGNINEALGDVEKAMNLQPNHPGVIDSLANIYIARKEFKKVDDLIKKLNSFPSYEQNVKELRGLLFAARGFKEESLKITKKSAAVYSLLGMRKSAVAIIENNINKNVVDRNWSYLYLKNHPFYISLQNDINFQKVLNKLKNTYEILRKKYQL